MNPNTTVGIEGWGKGASRLKNKSSKQDLITEISVRTKQKSLDIYTLTLKELGYILQQVKDQKLILSRVPLDKIYLKAPLINVLQPVLPKVRLNKLTVAALKELIGAFNDAK